MVTRRLRPSPIRPRNNRSSAIFGMAVVALRKRSPVAGFGEPDLRFEMDRTLPPGHASELGTSRLMKHEVT